MDSYESAGLDNEVTEGGYEEALAAARMADEELELRDEAAGGRRGRKRMPGALEGANMSMRCWWTCQRAVVRWRLKCLPVFMSDNDDSTLLLQSKHMLHGAVYCCKHSASIAGACCGPAAVTRTSMHSCCSFLLAYLLQRLVHNLTPADADAAAVAASLTYPCAGIDDDFAAARRRRMAEESTMDEDDDATEVNTAEMQACSSLASCAIMLIH
jgi:hypothetical protein